MAEEKSGGEGEKEGEVRSMGKETEKDRRKERWSEFGCIEQLS